LVLCFDKIIVHKIYEGKKKERMNGPEEKRKRRDEKGKNDIHTGRKETKTGRINSLF
jgi:hypothetical protein